MAAMCGRWHAQRAWLPAVFLLLMVEPSLHAGLPTESPARNPDKKAHSRPRSPPPSDPDDVFTASTRATEAAPAIIEEITAKYWKPGVANLAAGCSFWSPPEQCLATAKELLQTNDPEIHKYGDVLGLPELRKKLALKLKTENGIEGREVMVTAGANQAFVNVVLALCDPGDSALVFAPYYFSHRVALDLCSVNMLVADCDDELCPDVDLVKDYIQEAAEAGHPVKMVVVVSPGNPSGAVLSKKRMRELVHVCRENGVWLVSDETYENFLYDGAEHVSPTAPNGVINIFSFSKAYGMAGWRVGYVAYPPHLSTAMLKAQDTIPTMAPILSQKIALAALSAGSEWVKDKVAALTPSRDAIWDAVEPLNPIRSQGAFYFIVKLPSMIPELQAVRLLAERHRVLVTPGSAFGMEGHLRISYGSLKPAEAEAVAERLTDGLAELVRAGLRLTFDLQLSNSYSNGRTGPWGPLLGSEKELIQKEQGEGIGAAEDD